VVNCVVYFDYVFLIAKVGCIGSPRPVELGAGRSRKFVAILEERRNRAESRRVHNIQLSVKRERVTNEPTAPVRASGSGIVDLTLEDRPPQCIRSNLWPEQFGKIASSHEG